MLEAVESHGRLAGHSPDTRRTLAVAPLIAYQRCYGECPASVRRSPREGRVRDGRNSLAAGRGENTRPFSSLVGAAAETQLALKTVRAPLLLLGLNELPFRTTDGPVSQPICESDVPRA
jgi:hypothetical protein